MDANHFDQMTKAVSTPGARRRILSLLTGLPLVAGLSSLLGKDESDASGGRKRRGKHHPQRHSRLSAEKKRKNKKKKRKKKCKPQPAGQTCAGKCGTVSNNCKKPVDCGSCACDPPCPDYQVCDEASRTCGPDLEQEGEDCGSPGQVCQSDGSCSCTSETCSNPTPICVKHACAACTQHSDCGANSLCLDDGSCQACTVTCPGGTCTETALQAALTAGGTIYVCPGRYTGTFNALTNVTVIGAGDGTNSANDTILDALNTGRVFANSGASTTLSRLHLTGGLVASSGAGLYHLGGSLTMIDCTLAGNHSTAVGGGGIFNQGSSPSSSLNMTRCLVTGNQSSNSGGGIYSIKTLNMTNCQITSNGAGEPGGGIYAPSGAVTLGACSVTGNSASNGGGVVGTSPPNVTLLNGTTITGNTPNNCAGSVTGCTG